jgi:nitroreductase
MDLNLAITGRRAVRDYTAQGVDEKSIRALIDAAIQAPSAVNQGLDLHGRQRSKHA